MKIKHKAIQARAFEFLKVAEAHYGRSFREPMISTDLRGRCAGQAFYCQNKIRLNGGLLEKYPVEMMEETLPHEIAHLVVHEVYGRTNVKPHGYEWKNCMRVLGVNPKTRHNMNTDNCGGGRWARDNVYVCGDNCVEHRLTAVRHKRVQSGQTSLSCRKCGNTIRLKGTEKSVATDTGKFADQWSLTEFPMPKAANAPGDFPTVKEASADPMPKARKVRKPRKATPAKKAGGTWSPKPGSKGAAALEIYRDMPGMADNLMLDTLILKMNIKMGNARQYLKLCKGAKS